MSRKIALERAVPLSKGIALHGEGISPHLGSVLELFKDVKCLGHLLLGRRQNRKFAAVVSTPRIDVENIVELVNVAFQRRGCRALKTTLAQCYPDVSAPMAQFGDPVATMKPKFAVIPWTESARA